MTRFRIIALCAAMIGIGFASLSACSEEKTDERIQPDIWKSISQMHDDFGTETDCTKLFDAISQKVDKEEMARSCNEYKESLKKNGDLESLTHDQTNSGFYQAAFILFNTISNNVEHCEESARGTKKETVRETIKEYIKANEECESFIADCKTFMNSRDI